MTRLIGIVILLFGTVFVLFAGFFLVGGILTKADDHSWGKGVAVFLTIGVAASRYGWQCVRGFGKQEKAERQAKTDTPGK